MSVGLDLSGLNNLTNTENSNYLVKLNPLGGDRYSVVSSVGLAGQNSQDQVAIIIGSASASSNISGFMIASVNPFFQPIKSLVGWNSNALLFALRGSSAGLYEVFATSSGAFGNGLGIPVGTIFNKSANDIPFGLEAACFAEGTAIATPTGEVAVEDLRVGDMAITASGASRSILWIGQSTMRPAKHPRPHEVNPVRIRRGAFGENLPVRDLVLSPGHAVYIDGVLIPAGLLVNGATIVQEEAETIRYFHVELDSHDVILAAGLPCESYLDDGNRSAFANGGEAVELYGRLDPKSWEDACAPWVGAGPQLDEVRRALHAQAEQIGWMRSDEADLHLIVDGVTLAPLQVQGHRAWFQVPACAELTLGSNTGVLAQVMPGLSDLRCLGVAVGELRINGEALALDGPAFGAGFHALETQGEHAWRWTDGQGTLALALDAPAVIEVGLHMVAPSWKRRAAALKLVKMAS